VRVNSFLDSNSCEAVLAAIDDSLLGRYDPSNYESVAYRFGPTLNEHRQEGILRVDYWEKAEEARRVWRSQLGHTQIRKDCVKMLSYAWPGIIEPATVSGRELFWGLIREINQGTLIHWDEVTREYPHGLFDHQPSDQLALNVFLSVTANGGETLIWRKRWHPADEAYRVGYGYRPEVLGNEVPLSIKVDKGDAILFDPRNYHAVNKGEYGRRIAFASFIGISNNRLMLWS
jgi:hypothetical protein